MTDTMTATTTNVTDIIARVESAVAPVDSVTMFGISSYGLWTVGYMLSHLIPDDDDDEPGGVDEEEEYGYAHEDRSGRRRRRRRLCPATVKLKIDLHVAFILGTLAYMSGIERPEFDVIGWGHWLLMYFVNMLCFHHTARVTNLGRRRTAGIIMYATIPFATVLVAKIGNQVSESRGFISATTLLLLIPIKRMHTAWYREYDADSESGGSMVRVLGILALWFIQILVVCMQDDYSTKRGYQLAADIALLFLATDGVWDHW